jgi:hypothetical protein
MLVRPIHIVAVPHKVPHCFIEFYNTAMIAVYDDSHALGSAPNGQIGIECYVPIAGRLHEKNKTIAIVVLDCLQVS